MRFNKISKLTTFYVVIAVFMCVLSVFSFTYAWYVKNSTHYVGITFARPISILINNNVTVAEEIAGGTTDNVLPGYSINVNLSMSMAQDSSPAYIRARVIISPDEVLDENGQVIDWIKSEFIVVNLEDNIGENWVRVDFSNDPAVKDEWYVLRRANNISREMIAGENQMFVNGTIDFSANIDNRFASKNVNIVFEVEAIQTKNIEDPLANGIVGAKNSVWGSYR